MEVVSTRASPDAERRPESLNRMRHAVNRLVWGCCVACLSLGVSAPCAADGPADADRLTPRPMRSPTERSELARRLRETYRAEPGEWPAPDVDPGVAWRELGCLPEVTHPEGNAVSAGKVALGRTLFFDARLSPSGKLACVSCHEPALGWADGRAISEPRGALPGRNAPSILNVGFQAAFFWDGRAPTLERQAEMALTNAHEMASNDQHVVGLLESSPGYREMYERAYPGEPVTFAGVIKALACFERTVVGGRSRFDEFLRGEDSALTDGEIIGLDLFRREARCMNCHHGPAFSDGLYHDLGLSFYGRSNEDRGRYAVTRDARDVGRFRTPLLRNVTRTAPLMHTGTFGLRGVLTMYNAGMVTLKQDDFERDDQLFPEKSPHLRPLGLNRQDLADLEAFLHALEEPPAAVGRPPLPELQ
jgi:cytochrome c peroxidase